MKTLISETVGAIGEYGAFDDSAVKVGTTFGILPKSVSGILVGKEVASFKLKTSSRATKFPKAEQKLAAWAAANGVNAADYKVMPILFQY